MDDKRLALALLEMAKEPTNTETGDYVFSLDRLIAANAAEDGSDLSSNALLPPVDAKYKEIAPYRPCLQLALDMLIRLKLWSIAVKVALIHDSIETALLIFLRYYPIDSEHNSENISLQVIFDCAYRSDPVVFFKMYQFCRDLCENYNSLDEYYCPSIVGLSGVGSGSDGAGVAMGVLSTLSGGSGTKTTTRLYDVFESDLKAFESKYDMLSADFLS